METKVGQPVQVITPFGKGFELHPGIISSLDGGKNTEIRVFPNNGKDSYLLKEVRHIDFRKETEPCWRHLDESPDNHTKPRRSFFTKWF